MKIWRLVSGLWMAALLSCAEQRTQEPAARASSPDNALPAAPPAAAEPAPATPNAAPAPQGLDRPKSSESAPSEEFTTLEAAERALNQAKSDLDRLALANAPVDVGRAARSDGVRAENGDAKAGQAPSAHGAAASAAASTVCDNACRAFASLSRAARAVCRLDAHTGTHCGRAKRMVADSEQRVASCSCQSGD